MNSSETTASQSKIRGDLTDPNPAFLDVQAGAGGTEAQDWAEMLLRMYLKWGDRRGYRCELIEVSPGEVAGIKSATVYFQGDYAFGWLRARSSGCDRTCQIKMGTDQSAQRRAKLAQLRAEGDPYPNDFKRDALATDLQRRFGDRDHAALEAADDGNRRWRKAPPSCRGSGALWTTSSANSMSALYLLTTHS